MVVRAGPTLPCSSTAASVMRRRLLHRVGAFAELIAARFGFGRHCCMTILTDANRRCTLAPSNDHSEMYDERRSCDAHRFHPPARAQRGLDRQRPARARPSRVPHQPVHRRQGHGRRLLRGRAGRLPPHPHRQRRGDPLHRPARARPSAATSAARSAPATSPSSRRWFRTASPTPATRRSRSSGSSATATSCRRSTSRCSRWARARLRRAHPSRPDRSMPWEIGPDRERRGSRSVRADLPRDGIDLPIGWTPKRR